MSVLSLCYSFASIRIIALLLRRAIRRRRRDVEPLMNHQRQGEAVTRVASRFLCRQARRPSLTTRRCDWDPLHVLTEHHKAEEIEAKKTCQNPSPKPQAPKPQAPKPQAPKPQAPEPPSHLESTPRDGRQFIPRRFRCRVESRAVRP